MMLAVEEPEGIVLFSGCCHSGILNMIDRISEFFNDRPIKAVVGGFHLALQPGKAGMSVGVPDIQNMADRFVEKGIQHIFTGHCTGQDAYDALDTLLHSRMGRLSTGRTFTL